MTKECSWEERDQQARFGRALVLDGKLIDLSKTKIKIIYEGEDEEKDKKWRVRE